MKKLTLITLGFILSLNLFSQMKMVTDTGYTNIEKYTCIRGELPLETDLYQVKTGRAAMYKNRYFIFTSRTNKKGYVSYKKYSFKIVEVSKPSSDVIEMKIYSEKFLEDYGFDEVYVTRPLYSLDETIEYYNSENEEMLIVYYKPL